MDEHKIIGLDLVKDTEEEVQIIQHRLKPTSDRQRSYANLKRKDIEYAVGDKVFLKVSPWKKILRFGRKGKLSPRFIGPYEILERFGSVAYHLALPLESAKLHYVFHYLCFGDIVLTHRTYYQFKIYKYKKISLSMKSNSSRICNSRLESDYYLKVLFYTLFTTSFNHFLSINQPN